MIRIKITSKIFRKIQCSFSWPISKPYARFGFGKYKYLRIFLMDNGFLIPDFHISFLGYGIIFFTGHHEWWIKSFKPNMFTK